MRPRVRRIDEILAAPRGTGPLGPLKRLPAADGTEALWLQFAPNEDGPEGTVHVSPAWQDVVIYCVQELIRYSDPAGAVFSQVGDDDPGPFRG